MRSDSNQIAFEAVRSILEGAQPLSLKVAGTAVEVAVNRGQSEPWPEEGVEGVKQEPKWPSTVEAVCSWPGGACTLVIACVYQKRRKYRHNIILRASSGGQWLVWTNVKNAVEESENDVASLPAKAWWVKRRQEGDGDLSQHLNAVLQDLVSDSGLPRINPSTTEVCKIAIPDGKIVDGATTAFVRLIQLALLKLEFVDRRGLTNRGTPVIDLLRLGITPAQMAYLDRAVESDDAQADDDEESTDPAARMRQRIERSLPDERDRRKALELFAYAIQNADDERHDAWCVRERGGRLALFAGRILACRLRPGTVELSVLGPISDDVRTTLGAEVEDDEDFKAIPGGLLLSLHIEKCGTALDLLKDAFDRFVDDAMARVRRRVSADNHQPEVVEYISAVLGRPLPQPGLDAELKESDEEDDAVGEDDAPSREPRSRGRAPIFEHGQRSIASLISDVELKTIALPNLQRPFVWEDTKVRDLLDSLFVGFPVGTLVLWHISGATDARAIGGTEETRRASALVIDGQQRLTSLFAVMRGAEVIDKDGSKRRITIAFRPRDGRFEVADAAIRNDPEFIADVSELWIRERTKTQIRRDLLATLRNRGREIGDAYEDAVDQNLDRAQAISDYRFPVVDIRKTAANEEASEEDVAEIFVRINNQGMRLGQADFVLTLLSVFHGPLRDRLESRAAEISDESVVAIDTQQLLRATCAVGFGRAKMSAIYRYLRGVDPTTGDTSVADREDRLETLDRAAVDCIHTTTWRDYLLRVVHAGFVRQSLVASTNAIVNAFAFYVLGRRIGLAKPALDALTSRWLFGSLLTARYSGSSETVFEQDLSRVRDLKEGEGEAFMKALDAALAETITGDYWTHTVVGALNTQRGRAPAALAFRAAQIVLGSRALFSDQLLQNLLDPTATGARGASESHHLFPKAWLAAKGVTDRRRVNQVANLADIGWHENNLISSRGPATYVPQLRQQLKIDDDAWGRACAEHALPIGWETMDCDTFWIERRRRMAEIIRVAFRKLGGEAEATPLAPPWFLPGGEMVWRQIAETERSLRQLVREVYAGKYQITAAARIEAAIPAAQRDTLARALRSRPAGSSDPLSIVDYLYLGQLPPLLFSSDVWPDAKVRLGNASDVKQRLSQAIDQVAPVRNEIAHIREVAPERLQRASASCTDILAMIRG